MTKERNEYAELLLVEWFARRLRLDRLAEALPGDLYPPYLLVGIGLFTEYGILDVYNYFVTGKSSLPDDPGALVIGIGLLIAVVALRRLELSRREAIEDLHKLGYNGTAGGTESESFAIFQKFPCEYWIEYRQIQNEERDATSRNQSTVVKKSQSLIHFFQNTDLKSYFNNSERLFTPTVPLRYKIFAYLFGVVASAYNAFIILGYSQLTEIQGPLIVIISLLLFPVVYIPIIVDVAVLCFGISLSIPRQIIRANPDLFYHSPHRFGGLDTVGRTLRQSYFLYIFGFSSYVGILYLQAYDKIPSSYPPPPISIDLFFLGLGIAGAVAIGYSVYQIHTFMKQKRSQRLNELESEVRRRVDSPVDTYGGPTLRTDGWDAIQKEIDHVRNTRTYPFTPAASLRIGVGVLLPQVLNLLRLVSTTDPLAVVGA